MSAPTPHPIVLPKPDLAAGLPFPEALRQRRTSRELSDRPLPLQSLSNLLWAACGVNRRPGPFGGPGLTAASASNSQEIEVIVALENGAYRFDPLEHALRPVAGGDLRPLAIGPGQRERVQLVAPVELIYVADLDRLEHTQGFEEPGLHDPEVQKSYYFVDAGLIAGNVYLFAAAYGLGAWFHNCDRDALCRRLGLRQHERALFAQTVGYPA
jgi:hypothetical protein